MDAMDGGVGAMCCVDIVLASVECDVGGAMTKPPERIIWRSHA